MNGHSIYWHLPPLVLAVSFVYAATRHEDWNRIFWRTLFWVRYILGFLGSAFVALVLLEYFWEDWWIPALGAFLAWVVWKYVVNRKRTPTTQKELSSATTNDSGGNK